MKTKWLVLIAVLTGTVAFWGCGGSNATGPLPGMTELEGTWRYTESDWQLTFTFADSNWTVLEEELQDSTTASGTFALNTTVTPKHIDLLINDSSDTSIIGYSVLGIYALNSAATACTLATNDFGVTVRPTSFGTDPLVLTKQ